MFFFFYGIDKISVIAICAVQGTSNKFN